MLNASLFLTTWMPSPAMVPLYYSLKHVLDDDIYSCDGVLQFLIISLMFLVLENSVNSKLFLWLLVSPVLVVNMFLQFIHVSGKLFL